MARGEVAAADGVDACICAAHHTLRCHTPLATRTNQLDDPFAAAGPCGGADAYAAAEPHDPDVWAPPPPPQRAGPSGRQAGGTPGAGALRSRPEDRMPVWARTKSGSSAGGGGGASSAGGAGGPSGRRRAAVSSVPNSSGGGGGRAAPARGDSWNRRPSAGGMTPSTEVGGRRPISAASAGAPGAAAAAAANGGGGGGTPGAGAGGAAAAGVRARGEYLGPDGDLVANLERDMLDSSPGVRCVYEAAARAAALGMPGRAQTRRASCSKSRPKPNQSNPNQHQHQHQHKSPLNQGGATSPASPTPSACSRRRPCCR